MPNFCVCTYTFPAKPPISHPYIWLISLKPFPLHLYEFLLFNIWQHKKSFMIWHHIHDKNQLCHTVFCLQGGPFSHHYGFVQKNINKYKHSFWSLKGFFLQYQHSCHPSMIQWILVIQLPTRCSCTLKTLSICSTHSLNWNTPNEVNNKIALSTNNFYASPCLLKVHKHLCLLHVHMVKLEKS